MPPKKRDAAWAAQLASAVRNFNETDIRSRRRAVRTLVYTPSLVDLSTAGAEINNWPDADVDAFCRECLEFLRSLVRSADRPPGHASRALTVHGPITFRTMASRRGSAHSVAWGPARDLMRLQLVALVGRAGVHSLRICAAHGCDRLFVKTHKRTCCSITCLNRKTQKAKRDRDRAALRTWEAEQQQPVRKGRR
jgi:hypothetical protein